MRAGILLLLIVMVFGCAHKFTPQKVEQVIVSGKTTKQEILAAFGAPDRKSKTAGMKIISGEREYVVHKSREVWWYSPHQLAVLNVLEPEPLKVVFDDQGVVKHFELVHDD